VKYGNERSEIYATNNSLVVLVVLVVEATRKSKVWI
jgi:hypothetical protein